MLTSLAREEERYKSAEDVMEEMKSINEAVFLQLAMEGDQDKSGYRLMANVLLKKQMLSALTKMAEQRNEEARALRKADA